MSTTDIDNYMGLLVRYKLYIPLDHEYEAIINEYPVVPLIWFTTENGTWNKRTLLCIPDDSEELVMNQLAHAYQENAKNIRSVWTWTYRQLRMHLKFIEYNHAYRFRYIFHSVNGILRDSIIVVDERPVQGDKFEVLDMNDHEVWEMSPLVDNYKTMKRNLEEMAKYLECLKNGIDYEIVTTVQPQIKASMEIGYDDELSDPEL